MTYYGLRIFAEAFAVMIYMLLLPSKLVCTHIKVVIAGMTSYSGVFALLTH